MIARSSLSILAVVLLGMGTLNNATAQGVCYDMRLVASDTLPNNITAWDFQHWADDSSFGWACVNINGIQYKYRLSDAVAVTTFSDSVTQCGEDVELTYWEMGVGLIRTDSSSTGFAICLCSAARIAWLGEETPSIGIIVQIGLPNGERIGRHTTFWGLSQCSHGTTWEHDIGHMISWPALPEVSNRLMITRWTASYCDRMGDNVYDERGGGGVYDITQSSMLLDLGNTYNIALFSELSRMDFVCSNYFQNHTVCDGEPDCPTFWSALSTLQKFSLGGVNSSVVTLCQENFWCQDEGWVSPCYFSCGPASIAAQQDSDGFQRIVNSHGRCTDALNNQLLWQNSEVGGWMTSALLPGSVNERIVCSQQANRFVVYDAQTGNAIGRMSPMLGTLQYAIKRPNLTTEFVTYHAPTRVVRVYEPKFVVTGLTITRLSNSDTVRLKWNPVGGIAHYNIYSSSEYNGNYMYLADVNTGLSEWTMPVSQMDSIQFFYITAEY